MNDENKTEADQVSAELAAELKAEQEAKRFAQVKAKVAQFIAYRKQFVPLCQRATANVSFLSSSNDWFNGLRREIQKVSNTIGINLVDFTPINEVAMPQFIEEYKAGNPALRRLGWGWVSRVPKYYEEHQQLQDDRKDYVKKIGDLGAKLNALEVEIRATGFNVPADHEIGI